MVGKILASLLCALLATTDASAPDATQPVPVVLSPGESRVVFTQRSPLSAYAKLVDRLNVRGKGIGPDYQLDQQPFCVYVPKDDGSGKPPGLMVCVDGSGYLQSLYPVWDAHHLIFISPMNSNLPESVTLGLTLDAFFNVQRSRPIDPARIYLMGYRWGENIGFCTGDIFTGDMYFWAIGYFRRVDGGRYHIPAVLSAPKDEYLSFAKTRPQALGFEDETDSGHDTYHNLVVAGMKQDGFERVFKELVPFGNTPRRADVEKLLPLLEAAPPATQPAAVEAPPVSEAQHLLKLAQMYIANQQPDNARDKLNQILQQYPDDPAAQTAKDLLSQLQPQ